MVFVLRSHVLWPPPIASSLVKCSLCIHRFSTSMKLEAILHFPRHTKLARMHTLRYSFLLCKKVKCAMRGKQEPASRKFTKIYEGHLHIPRLTKATRIHTFCFTFHSNKIIDKCFLPCCKILH